MDSSDFKEKKRFLLIPMLGIFLGLFCYFAFIFFFILFYLGGYLTRTILLGILLYQFTLCKKNDLWRKFLKFLKPWEYFKDVQLITEEPLKPSKSLFCFHPHGVLGYGFSMSPGFNEVLYKTEYCGSRAMINLPISGIFARWMGLNGVDHLKFKDFMSKGKNISFIPGGFEEATITNSSKDRIYIKERKGFIKYSLQHGYIVHPVYTFNENKIYNTINIFETFRLFLNKLKFPGALFYGNYFILPRNDLVLAIVIGKGIEFPTIDNPDSETINKYHEIYINSLKDLYNRHKSNYCSSEELEIL